MVPPEPNEKDAQSASRNTNSVQRMFSGGNAKNWGRLRGKRVRLTYSTNVPTDFDLHRVEDLIHRYKGHITDSWAEDKAGLRCYYFDAESHGQRFEIASIEALQVNGVIPNFERLSRSGKLSVNNTWSKIPAKLEFDAVAHDTKEQSWQDMVVELIDTGDANIKPIAQAFKQCMGQTVVQAIRDGNATKLMSSDVRPPAATGNSSQHPRLFPDETCWRTPLTHEAAFQLLGPSLFQGSAYKTGWSQEPLEHSENGHARALIALQKPGTFEDTHYILNVAAEDATMGIPRQLELEQATCVNDQEPCQANVTPKFSLVQLHIGNFSASPCLIACISN